MPGVYLSFPFCAQKCSFCNFASGVFPRELEREYIDSLLSEIRAHDWEWTPNTVYIGGGTPSRISGADLSQILAAVPGRPWREGTMEAAPSSLTRDGIRSWVGAGLNRVSLGVQSFVSSELARTGRKHTSSTVEQDVAMLRDVGIHNINVDLIAGLPGQTIESWNLSLDWIERLSPPHVSVYLFEIDEDSRLGLEVLNNGQRYGAGTVPDDETMATLYETAVQRLARMDIHRYEISNFARPGFESLHNLKYWKLEPYIGFGADAHSFDGISRWGNTEAAADYVTCMRDGLSVKLQKTDACAEEERFFVGLRLMKGVRPEPTDWKRYAEPIARLVGGGLLRRDGEMLRLTDRGVLVSNEVFQEFVP